jgi:flavin-dependent dehydrogenase
MSADIAVVGTGPAGAATSCALARLGFRVLAFGGSRTTAVEGISPRTRALLIDSGLQAAVQAAGPAVQRSGVWAGAPVAHGTEYIVDRTRLDEALRDDLRASGVELSAERILRIEPAAGGWRVRTQTGRMLECPLVIDARGRRAQRGTVRRPRLLAITQRLALTSRTAVRTWVEPALDGWCWLASRDDSAAYLQVVVSSRAKHALDLQRRMRSVVSTAPRIAALVAAAIPQGDIEARGGTPGVSPAAPHRGLLRVGDVCVALDSLSGHGIHEALRSAKVTVSAAHTFLSSGEWDAVAQFVNERTQQVWSDAVDTAASYYGQQAATTPGPFWSEAAADYAVLRERARAIRLTGCRIESRPVLNGACIERKRVVLTPEHPRGVWQVDSVELAPLLDFLQAAPAADLMHVARELRQAPPAVASATRWLTSHGLVRREFSCVES